MTDLQRDLVRPHLLDLSMTQSTSSRSLEERVANVTQILDKAVSPIFTAQNSPSTPTNQSNKGKQRETPEEAVATLAQQKVDDFWPPVPEITEEMFHQKLNPLRRRTSLPTTKELQRLKRDIAEVRAAIAMSRTSLSPKETVEPESRPIPQPIIRHESLPSVSKTLTWALPA